MHYTTLPATREQFITGLRELADYLEAHPAVPVPVYGTDITVGADPTEDGGRGQVAHIAAMLGATITDDTRQGGHFTATRMFGPIGYTVVSIPATVMAAHYAHDSYYGYVTPDMP
jgi:hypothetical protein